MIVQTFRWRVFTASSFALALVALAIACGDDANVTSNPPPDASSSETSAAADAQADGTSPTSTDVEAFCNATLGLYAPMYEECCDPAAAPKKYSFDHTLLGVLSSACTEALGKSIASGRAELVPAAAATCQVNVSAAIKGRSCPDVHRTPSNQPSTSIFYDAQGCSEAVVGRQGADAPCSNDYECQDGLTCVGWTPQSDGSCKAPPGESAPCGYAIPDGGGFIDILHWGFGTHPRCAAGFYCASTALQQGTCRASQPADGDCDSDDACAEGLRCQLGVCGTAGPAPAGAPCERNSDCQDRLYCKSTDGGRQCASRQIAGTPCSGSLSPDCEGACVEPDGGGAGTCVAYCGSQ